MESVTERRYGRIPSVKAGSFGELIMLPHLSLVNVAPHSRGAFFSLKTENR